MITGSKIILTSLNYEDFIKFIANIWPECYEYTQSDIFSYGLKIHSIKESRKNIYYAFSIYSNALKANIGTIWLENIKLASGTAKLNVLASRRLQDIASEISEGISLFVKIIVEYVNLNKIYCRIPDENTLLKEIFKQAAFEEEALLKGEYFKGGQYKDVSRLAFFRNAHKTPSQKKSANPIEIQWFQSSKYHRK